MRLSQQQISILQKLLKERFGLVYTDEQAQQAGLAIMRFFVAKELQLKSVEKSHGQMTNGV